MRLPFLASDAHLNWLVDEVYALRQYQKLLLFCFDIALFAIAVITSKHVHVAARDKL
jgi:hypothetical protein